MQIRFMIIEVIHAFYLLVLVVFNFEDFIKPIFKYFLFFAILNLKQYLDFSFRLKFFEFSLYQNLNQVYISKINLYRSIYKILNFHSHLRLLLMNAKKA